MDFFYFLVTGSPDYDNVYHLNFFENCGGFSHGIIAALIIGLIISAAFYFGCCNSRTSQKSANIGMWFIFMAIAALIGYFYADFVIMGETNAVDNTGIFREYSFYKANEDYYTEQSRVQFENEQLLDELFNKKGEIQAALDRGEDVRFDFDLTTALLAALFFFFPWSVLLKRFTINGKAVPFLKP